jgi:protein SHQ1
MYFSDISKICFNLKSEYGLIIDLPDPDETSVEQRKLLRIENESTKFYDDHYLADLFENTEMIDELLAYDPEYESQECSDYTDKEIDTLKSLPKKTYLLDTEQKMITYCGLVDILFAYCYNKRINMGEENSESSWTIAKLSSTLSWFDVFKSLDECVIASFRRSLCFPLYRNWKLSKKVYRDVIKLLESGRQRCIKSLLEIRSNFIDGDCRYILNDLYINDYCVWMQYVR